VGSWIIKNLNQFYGARKSGQNEMRNLQEDELFHDSQQEKTQRKIGDEKILPEMQKAHDAQRDEIARQSIKSVKSIKS
jgi:hypothetical protein